MDSLPSVKKNVNLEYTGERFVPSDEMMGDETAFEHFHRYYHVRDFVKEKIVLDIACGEGYGAALLSEKAKKVYGVDIDNTCIEHAKTKYQNKNIEFIKGDASQIPLSDNSIDVVISFETIEHLDEKKQELFLNELKRVLKKNGKLVVSTPDKNNYSERYSHQNEFHIKEFTKEEFHSFLKKYFQNIASLGQRYEVVDAITGEDGNELSQAKVLNWNRTLKPFSSKYLISICSDFPIEKELLYPSLVFQVSKNYWELTDRIVEMEAHIHELGAWGRRLDKEIEEKNVAFNSKLKELEEISVEKKTWLEKESQFRISDEKQLALLQKLTTDLENKNNLIGSFGRNFQETTEKMIEMQNRLFEMNEWTRKFHYELLQKDALLNEKNKEIDNLNVEKKLWFEKETQLKEELKTITTELNTRVLYLERAATEMKQKAEKEAGERLEIIRKLESESNDKNKIISEQKEHFQNLEQKLDSANSRLAEIYQSEGWKALKRYYNIKGRLLPEDSKRYEVLKTIVNKLRGKKENANYFNENKAHSPIVDKPKPNQEFSVKTYELLEFPVFEFPKVSIVMPAYNGWDLTYSCLLSIKENTLGVAYEIIIGDDASTDETKNIKNYVRNITVIRNEKNLEFLHNCNNAARYAKGKYILFLNNDVEVKTGWLSSMIDLMEKDETVGMVGSKLIYPNGKLQEAGGIIWRDASGWNFGHNQNPDAPEFNYVKEVDYISGASIVIRTDLWKQIGGFDERYSPAYCEDSDLAFEVRKYGYKVVYQPLSEIVHYEGYTHGTDQNEGIKGTEIKAYQKLNNEKFRQKWKDVLEKEHFSNGENVFWARDRSRDRKTILVIDHYVPQFDKDAGSKTVFQYLNLFVSLNLNVKFIGDNFYRHEPYTTILQQMGIEVLYGHEYANNWQQWVKDNGDKFDFILLNRPHISIKYIDFVKQHTKAKILYYGHDLHFMRMTRQYEIEGRKELLNEAEKWKQIEMSLFNKADIILAPSIQEQNLIKSLGIERQIIPIAPYMFDKFADCVCDFSVRKDIFFIGGFTHTPNIDGVLWFNKKVWPLVKQKLPEAEFIIAGSNPPAEILSLESDDVHVIGHISEKNLQKLYESVKLVVIPLRYGAGVKGKTVEAMFHGVPIVSTQFGLEGLPLGYTDFLRPYDTSESFAEQVILLYMDDDQLKELSKKESTYINENFTLEAATKALNFIMQGFETAEA